MPRRWYPVVDAQLVEEHGRGLVGVGYLRAGHEADRKVTFVCDQQMVGGLAQEAGGRILTAGLSNSSDAARTFASSPGPIRAILIAT